MKVERDEIVEEILLGIHQDKIVKIIRRLIICGFWDWILVPIRLAWQSATN